MKLLRIAGYRAIRSSFELKSVVSQTFGSVTTQASLGRNGLQVPLFALGNPAPAFAGYHNEGVP